MEDQSRTYYVPFETRSIITKTYQMISKRSWEAYQMDSSITLLLDSQICYFTCSTLSKTILNWWMIHCSISIFPNVHTQFWNLIQILLQDYILFSSLVRATFLMLCSVEIPLMVREWVLASPWLVIYGKVLYYKDEKWLLLKPSPRQAKILSLYDQNGWVIHQGPSGTQKRFLGSSATI